MVSDTHRNLLAYVSTHVFMFFNKELTEGSLFFDFCGNSNLTNCEFRAKARRILSTALYNGICLAISNTESFLR